MEKAIRIECYQNLVNYRKPSSILIKESFPLPPYSTVLGMIHAACQFTEFHPMKLSIQGSNAGSVSEVYTRYSFKPGAKYEKERHQICIDEGDKQYGVFKGIGHVELICDNHMILHVAPAKEDLQTVYNALKYPPRYLSLGRYEDILDVINVELVELYEKEGVDVDRDIYIPVDTELDLGNYSTTIYTLTKEYEPTKPGQIRRWKKDGGKVKAYYFLKGTTLDEGIVDEHGDLVVLV